MTIGISRRSMSATSEVDAFGEARFTFGRAGFAFGASSGVKLHESNMSLK
jgi:hypothetical protein